MLPEEPRLDLETDVDGALVLRGEVDSYTAPDLAARLGGDPAVDVIDLAGVTFIDSSGLRVLVEVHQARIDAGSRLALRAPSASVQRLLEISGLSGHLDVTS
ncbi:MAG: STAS domain-containing protein [Ilumatobacteraceae bacterium]